MVQMTHDEGEVVRDDDGDDMPIPRGRLNASKRRMEIEINGDENI